MKIAIIGYGKMGQEIEKICKERKHQIIAIIDPNSPKATHKAITADALKGIDVAIEFTHPSVAVKNIETLAKLKKNVVVGTTGWTQNLKTVKNAV